MAVVEYVLNGVRRRAYFTPSRLMGDHCIEALPAREKYRIQLP